MNTNNDPRRNKGIARRLARDNRLTIAQRGLMEAYVDVYDAKLPPTLANLAETANDGRYMIASLVHQLQLGGWLTVHRNRVKGGNRLADGVTWRLYEDPLPVGERQKPETRPRHNKKNAEKNAKENA